MSERGTCYGCQFLVQCGSGVSVCLRFDHDGDNQGTILLDDEPKPLYEDCYTPWAASATVVRRGE